MRHFFLIFLLLTGWAAESKAQTSLKQCLEMARLNYPLIQRYDLIRRGAEYTVANIKKGWLPQVQLSVQGSIQNRAAQFPEQMKTLLSMSGYSIQGMPKEQYRLQMEVTQTLWDGQRMARGADVARREASVEAAQNEVGLYQVQLRVRDLFFALLLVDERIRLNLDLQQLLQSNEDRLERMLRRGVAMQSDVDQVRVERLGAVQTGDELLSLRRATGKMLALFCGVAQIDSLEKPPLPAEDQAAPTLRPELALIDRRLHLADAQARSLRSQLLPTLGLFAQGYYGRPGFNLFDDMTRRRPSLNALLGVCLSWSIGSVYTLRNNLRRIEVQRAEAENARQVFVFNNQLEQTQHRERIEARRRWMQTDDEILALRTRVRRAAEAQLLHGTIDIHRLLQEITRENTARIARSTHEIEWLQAQYELEMSR